MYLDGLTLQYVGDRGAPKQSAYSIDPRHVIINLVEMKIVYHIGNSIWNRDQLKLPQINTYYYTILIDYKKI